VIGCPTTKVLSSLNFPRRLTRHRKHRTRGRGGFRNVDHRRLLGDLERLACKIVDSQGESAFVWSVIGGIATTTSQKITTGVTCPTFRIHPAIIAQAAATSQIMAGSRFVLGVGSEAKVVTGVNDHSLFCVCPRAVRRATVRPVCEAVAHAMATHGNLDRVLTDNGKVFMARFGPGPGPRVF
jgi:hypothetical protein